MLPARVAEAQVSLDPVDFYQVVHGKMRVGRLGVVDDLVWMSREPVGILSSLTYWITDLGVASIRVITFFSGSNISGTCGFISLFQVSFS